MPHASYSQPFLVPWDRDSKGAQEPLQQAGTELMVGTQSWEKVLAAYSLGLTLTCSFSSCSPKVEMPPVEVRRGVLGRRHTFFSRSQDTLGFRVGNSSGLRNLGGEGWPHQAHFIGPAAQRTPTRTPGSSSPFPFS